MKSEQLLYELRFELCLTHSAVWTSEGRGSISQVCGPKSWIPPLSKQTSAIAAASI